MLLPGRRRMKGMTHFSTMWVLWRSCRFGGQHRTDTPNQCFSADKRSQQSRAEFHTGMVWKITLLIRVHTHVCITCTDVSPASRIAVVGLKEFHFNPVVMLVFGNKWSTENQHCNQRKGGKWKPGEHGLHDLQVMPQGWAGHSQRSFSNQLIIYSVPLQFTHLCNCDTASVIPQIYDKICILTEA